MDTTINSATVNPPVRVMLWTVPRSLATVLCKCLSFVPGAHILYEPFLSAWEFGPERSVISSKESGINQKFHSAIDKLVPELDGLFPDTNWYDSHLCTYDWVKNTLESQFDPDVKMVLCKDMVYAMTGHYDKIPQGYQHVFLIRNPSKQMPSWQQMMLKSQGSSKEEEVRDKHDKDLQQLPLTFDIKYAEMLKLYKYISKHHQERPLVIDADDLQNHTASILSQLLETIDVPYQESLLNWEQSDDFAKRWVLAKINAYGNIIRGEKGWYYNAFSSTCIRPAREAPDQEALPQDIVDMVWFAMPIYEELYQLRLKP